jgi:hypothetical protein
MVNHCVLGENGELPDFDQVVSVTLMLLSATVLGLRKRSLKHALLSPGLTSFGPGADRACW